MVYGLVVSSFWLISWKRRVSVAASDPEGRLAQFSPRSRSGSDIVVRTIRSKAKQEEIMFLAFCLTACFVLAVRFHR